MRVGIAILDQFFQSRDSGLRIWNPGIPAGLQDLAENMGFAAIELIMLAVCV